MSNLRVCVASWMTVDALIDGLTTAVELMEPGECSGYLADKLEQAAKIVRDKFAESMAAPTPEGE